MNKGLIVSIFLCLLLISFVSAGFWGDLYTKITGKAITGKIPIGIPGEDYTGCTGPNGEAYGPADPRCGQGHDCNADPTGCPTTSPSTGTSGGATGTAYVPPFSRDPNLICTRKLTYVAVGSGPIYETICRKDMTLVTPPIQTPDVCKEEVAGKKYLCKSFNLPRTITYTGCVLSGDLSRQRCPKSYYPARSVKCVIPTPINCDDTKYASCSKCASCVSQPKITNAEFNIGTPTMKNQAWYEFSKESPEKPACSWWCKEGYQVKINEVAEGAKYTCVENEEKEEKKCTDDPDLPLVVWGKGEFAETGSDPAHICCPSNIDLSKLIYLGGFPNLQCKTCSNNEIRVWGKKRTAETGSWPTSYCCQTNFPYVQYSAFESNTLKCGKCKAFNNLVCKGDCSFCDKSNQVVKLDSSSADENGNCKKVVVEDCTKSNKICTEHVSNQLEDISAQCEPCPKSLTFVTKTEEHFQKTSDGHEFLEKGSGFISENTFFSFETPEEIFDKISEISKKCSGNFITLIFINHGGPGVQIFGDDKIRLDVSYFKQLESKKYDFSSLKSVIFGGCEVGKCKDSREGELFINQAEEFFSQEKKDKNGEPLVKAYAANEEIQPNYDKKVDTIIEGGKIVTIVQGSLYTPHTIFFSTGNNLIYPGMPEFAYQTEVYEGDLGEVKIYMNSLSQERDKIGIIEDEDMLCNYEIIESKDFVITSNTQSVAFGELSFSVPAGNVLDGKIVKMKINKIKIDCSNFYKAYPSTPVPDEAEYNKFSDAYNQGIISQELFNRVKSEYKNKWQCMLDKECYGPCIIGIQNCDYKCESHKCVISRETLCNGKDDNGNGKVDEGGACPLVNYYCDRDYDNYKSSVPSGSCNTFKCVPSGCKYNVGGKDCNDNNVLINPGAKEISGNKIDDNCNGKVDEAERFTLTCVREYTAFSGISKCDPKNCESTAGKFVRCNIKKIVFDRKSYNQICMWEYETTCMENPKCKLKYIEKNRTIC